jgi:hypothetical protein
LKTAIYFLETVLGVLPKSAREFDQKGVPNTIHDSQTNKEVIKCIRK